MTCVLIMIDDEGDLSDEKQEERTKAVENHKKWVDAAAALGCHAIRVNTGHHYSPTNVGPIAEACGMLTDYGAKNEIKIICENHGGPSSDPDALLALMKAVNRSDFGTLPDFGNFPQEKGKYTIDIYDAIARMMPYAKGVSAKSYDFDESGKETKLDFARIMKIVTDANYHGFVGIEYEGGKLSEPEAYPCDEKAASTASARRRYQPGVRQPVARAEFSRSGRWGWIPLGVSRSLVPVGIRRICGARGVELGDLFRGQAPADCAQILAELLLVACAEDDRRDRGAPENPVEGDLWDRLVGFERDHSERIDDAEEVFVGDRRADREIGGHPRAGGRRLISPDFAGELAHREGAPDDGADLLVDRQGHELPLVVTADQRIVSLMADVARQAIFFRAGE